MVESGAMESRPGIPDHYCFDQGKTKERVMHLFNLTTRSFAQFSLSGKQVLGPQIGYTSIRFTLSS